MLCGFAGWESQLLRTGGCGGFAVEDMAKFAPRLRARAIWKSKSLKTESLGRLLEVEVAQICTTPARESDSEVKIVKNWEPRKLKSPKFAPRLRARTIWKSKSLRTESLGRLLEVEVAKICTTPARENDLEVKIVKKWEVRSTFGSSSRQNLHHACARERFGSQNR